MEVFLARKLFVLPGKDDDECKVVEETRVFASYEEAFKKFNEYRGELSDEVAEGDLEDYIKEDNILSATTYSGKKLMVWITKQSVIE